MYLCIPNWFVSRGMREWRTKIINVRSTDEQGTKLHISFHLWMSWWMHKQPHSHACKQTGMYDLENCDNDDGKIASHALIQYTHCILLKHMSIELAWRAESRTVYGRETHLLEVEWKYCVNTFLVMFVVSTYIQNFGQLSFRPTFTCLFICFAGLFTGTN